MRIVFFGTPEFAVPALARLIAAPDIEVVAVVTQPDRPRGRSHSTLRPPPVKVLAEAARIPVLQPLTPKDPDFVSSIADLSPDLGVVVAYGHLLRPDLLAIPQMGMVNVHASILPRWRGAGPITWAVMSGDEEAGISIMRVERGLDSGAVWQTATTPINSDDTTGTLTERLAALGADTLMKALPSIAAGSAPTPQQDELATLAPKIDRDTARVDWQQPAAAVSRLIRAMDPAPGAWTMLDGNAVKLFGARVLRDGTGLAPGEFSTTEGVMVGCGEGAVSIGDLQQAGKKRLSALEWSRGLAIPSRRFE